MTPTDDTELDPESDSAAGLVEDLRDDITLADIAVLERLAELVVDFAQIRPRGAACVALRLGLDGERPETFTRLAARYDITRDRARQLYTQAVGKLLQFASQTGRLPIAECAERFPITRRDSELTRDLLVQTYAMASDLAVGDLCYLKLRLAGHTQTDAKRISGYVYQRIAAWRVICNHRLRRLRDTYRLPEGLANWLEGVEWPAGHASPAALPAEPIHTLDADDEGRGRFYLNKVGREVGFDSGLEAQLLRACNSDPRIRTFCEHPEALAYQVERTDLPYRMARLDLSYRGEETERVHFPSVVLQLTDGRCVVVEVQPLGQLAWAVNRAKARVTREWATQQGWGYVTWTGSALSETALRTTPVLRTVETVVRQQLSQGPLNWRALWALRQHSGVELLDLTALALRHGWRLDRAPFRLSLDEADG